MSSQPLNAFENYETPADVLADQSLSRAGKIRVLKTWAETEEAKTRAAAEGMAPTPVSDANQLVAIRAALLELNEDTEQS